MEYRPENCECLKDNGLEVKMDSDGEEFVEGLWEGVTYAYPPILGTKTCETWMETLPPCVN